MKAKQSLPGTRCSAWVTTRKYSPAGQCEIKREVKLVRWAPTPLRTRVMLLCSVHRLMLEDGRPVETIKERA